MRRFTVPAIAGLSLIAGLGAVSADAVAHSLARSASVTSKWTLHMKFNAPAHTGTYYLDPLKKTGQKLTGKVKPPNTECPGSLTGTLKHGKIKATITYPGTPCSGDQVTMKGKMKFGKPHTGKTSGTFTSNYYCTGTCKFSGVRT